MKSIKILTRYLTSNVRGDSLAQTILEQDATLADRTVHDELLKDLLLKYALAEQEVRRLNTLKNTFLGMAAHDLRNPLAAIRGFSELLQGDVDETSRKEFLTMIQSASQEMFQMLDDLLDISHMENGALTLRCTLQDMRELVRSRVERIRTSAARKGMALTTSITSPPPFFFDADRIGQAMDNFLTNAVKYSPQDAIIGINLSHTKKNIRFTVRDQGPGISKEEQQKLFKEFSRASTQTTGGEKSTGLGLSIAKKIIEAHGGNIGVQSKQGEGSSFYFELPLQNPASVHASGE